MDVMNRHPQPQLANKKKEIRKKKKKERREKSNGPPLPRSHFQIHNKPDDIKENSTKR